MGCDDDELAYAYPSLDSYRREKNPTGMDSVVDDFLPTFDVFFLLILVTVVTDGFTRITPTELRLLLTYEEILSISENEDRWIVTLIDLFFGMITFIGGECCMTKQRRCFLPNALNSPFLYEKLLFI